MSERKSLLQQQYAFAAHIRDPQHAAPPAGIEDRRMGIYRELFFNNLDSLLTDTLPVLHRLLAPAHWASLVRDFMVKHRAHSPYFLDIPREFLSYLEHERGTHATEHFRDPPFLYELAHYEWIELALSVHDAEVKPDGIDPGITPGIDIGHDLLDGHPLLSPYAWPLQYRFDVQRIRPEYQPTEPPVQPTYLLIYRDAEDGVRFLELNPVSARLFSLLAEHADDPTYTGRLGLESVCQELQHPHPETVVAHGAEQLRDWQARGIILGTPTARIP
jgi:hypothetical protein